MNQSPPAQPFFFNLRTAIALAILLALALAVVGWFYLFRVGPGKSYVSDADHYSYASMGTEEKEGLPMAIWKILPELFADKLPLVNGEAAKGIQGYEAFGMLSQSGHILPVGITSKTIGFERQGLNCAICHTSSYRRSAKDIRQVVLGGPSSRFDTQGYLRFLFASAKDPRFTADAMMPLINRDNHLNPVERLLYRYLLIPQTRSGILTQSSSYSWMEGRPSWGPGRIDPFNPVKFRMLGLADDGTIGNSDMMPLWNMANHDGFVYHWDGLEKSLHETIIEGALGDGASLKSVNLPALQRVESFIGQVQPPAFPFPIDQVKATRGGKVFAGSCASCHGTGGARTGTVIPIEEVATDPNRLRMWTKAAVDAYSAYADGYSFDFKNLQKQNGYVAVGLEGIWLRGPYLHNGSVPTLKALLSPPSERPTEFVRGIDIIDPESVGFVSSGTEIEGSGWRYDTRIQANGNEGHTYGVDLSTEEKLELLEFLKTL